MLQIVTDSTEATVKLGEKLGKCLWKGAVICLIGDLGTGKTTFVKGLARGLGVEEPVTSPTFTLINQYQGKFAVCHLDVYRLEDPEEIFELGLEDCFQTEKVIIIEWAEKILDLLTGEYLLVEIRRADSNEEDKRLLVFQPRGSRFYQLLEEWEKQCEY
ncbi:tRNA (adenosine(37)-N6)-threonylcarbamoyltransferase complex ATPase subunit type 1 TsaE [Calderihabitans maritimus]|uniref:tRNA threonylcarbamoyladenosine biosynthesis protein TsaE n=1 Tax=Calderihabitans maritimus TaxID=1246530 RepID=A0A1Z5HSL3_9FIRM|nr:tRNA (adenosine(37)-N6)-threonylcarbamoyltransferase complex ATPase subunit type 1 TsaE [Calderihabitans maritimus]GAW92512.1 hypothetical protein TherJR_0728 [Calderihabitans maritimus]